MTISDKRKPRTRIIRGKEKREYDQHWVEWHAKYDKYTTSNGKHKLNMTNAHEIACLCGDSFYGGTEDQRLVALTAHLAVSEPVRIDVTGVDHE